MTTRRRRWYVEENGVRVPDDFETQEAATGHAYRLAQAAALLAAFATARGRPARDVGELEAYVAARGGARLEPTPEMCAAYKVKCTSPVGLATRRTK